MRRFTMIPKTRMMKMTMTVYWTSNKRTIQSIWENESYSFKYCQETEWYTEMALRHARGYDFVEPKQNFDLKEEDWLDIKAMEQARGYKSKKNKSVKIQTEYIIVNC